MPTVNLLKVMLCETFKMEHPKKQIYCCLHACCEWLLLTFKKAPYVAKTEKCKVDYEKNMKNYNNYLVKQVPIEYFKEEGRNEDEAVQFYSQRLMMLRMVVKSHFVCVNEVDLKRLKDFRLLEIKSRSQQDDALYWCTVECILPSEVKPQDAVKDILKFMENI
ncbi:hypothetical protein Bca4012_082415 [Brassica carinata]|uniref:Uncharacterized protein n=1 Tax=Brassica carinata TaxID=52824 RepID=A0A8X8AMM4_BRACI|nr:hypothetical protein Bca52824_028248 [Brassica carinata]